MTKDEAKKGLQRLAKEFNGYKPNEEMFTIAIDAINDNAELCKVNLALTENVDCLKEQLEKSKKPQWIPISERLPEKFGTYLVTVKEGYMALGVWIGELEYWANVVAWMQSPEPYKEVKE